MNVTEYIWWQVHNGSGNGLVPSGNKPLAEPMLTQFYVAIWCHKVTMSYAKSEYEIKKIPSDTLNHVYHPSFPCKKKIKLERLERLRSEDTPPPPHDYPFYWVILYPESKEDKVTNLKNSPKFQIFLILKQTLYATHLLKLLDKMYKYEMDPMIQSGHHSVQRRTDWRTDGHKLGGLSGFIKINVQWSSTLSNKGLCGRPLNMDIVHWIKWLFVCPSGFYVVNLYIT